MGGPGESSGSGSVGGGASFAHGAALGAQVRSQPVWFQPAPGSAASGLSLTQLADAFVDTSGAGASGLPEAAAHSGGGQAGDQEDLAFWQAFFETTPASASASQAPYAGSAAHDASGSSWHAGPSVLRSPPDQPHDFVPTAAAAFPPSSSASFESGPNWASAAPPVGPLPPSGVLHERQASTSAVQWRNFEASSAAYAGGAVSHNGATTNVLADGQYGHAESLSTPHLRQLDSHSPDCASLGIGDGPSAFVFPPLSTAGMAPSLALPNAPPEGRPPEASPPAAAAAAAGDGKRASVACLLCRKRKLRCDQAQPCMQCERRGLQCAYELTASQVYRTDDSVLRRKQSMTSQGASGRPAPAGPQEAGQRISPPQKRSFVASPPPSSTRDAEVSGMTRADEGSLDDHTPERRRRVRSARDVRTDRLHASGLASTEPQQDVAWVTCAPAGLISAMEKVRLADESDVEDDAASNASEVEEPQLGREVGGDHIMNGWYDDLLGELGSVRANATRRLRGLLLGFTARHTVTCLVLHTPTLLEPTFSESRRRSVHPALYFAIASIAVVDHEMDRLEPITGVVEEASPATRALSERLSARALQYIQTDAISQASSGMTIQAAQSAQVLALIKRGDLRVSLLELITRVVESLGLMKLVKLEDPESLRPIKPHNPAYYELPRPPPPGTTSVAEVRRELIVRLCWARAVHSARRVQTWPDVMPEQYKFEEVIPAPGHWSAQDFLRQHQLNSSLELYFVSRHLFKVAAWCYYIGHRALMWPKPRITSPFQAVGVFRRALATASQIEEAESHFPFFRPKDNNDLIRTVLGRHCLGVGTVLTKLRLNLYQRGRIWRGRNEDVSASVTAPSGLPHSTDVYLSYLPHMIARIESDFASYKETGVFASTLYEVNCWQRHVAFATELFRVTRCELFVAPIQRMIAAVSAQVEARSPMPPSPAYDAVDWQALKTKIATVLAKRRSSESPDDPPVLGTQPSP